MKQLILVFWMLLGAGGLFAQSSSLNAKIATVLKLSGSKAQFVRVIDLQLNYLQDSATPSILEKIQQREQRN